MCSLWIELLFSNHWCFGLVRSRPLAWSSRDEWTAGRSGGGGDRTEQIVRLFDSPERTFSFSQPPPLPHVRWLSTSKKKKVCNNVVLYQINQCLSFEANSVANTDCNLWWTCKDVSSICMFLYLLWIHVIRLWPRMHIQSKESGFTTSGCTYTLHKQ